MLYNQVKTFTEAWRLLWDIIGYYKKRGLNLELEMVRCIQTFSEYSVYTRINGDISDFN